MLDTHAFLWWDSTPEKLSSRAYQACMDSSNFLHLSYASVWEIQIKVQTGKLQLRLPLAELLREHQMNNGVILETIDIPDVLRLGTLPLHHRDPFDRMIIAQTLQRGFHLMSVDSLFGPYAVPMYW
jgi:PIN domain nuclease of toxin-antitoxin system